jgi:hypothetical protein
MLPDTTVAPVPPVLIRNDKTRKNSRTTEERLGFYTCHINTETSPTKIGYISITLLSTTSIRLSLPNDTKSYEALKPILLKYKLPHTKQDIFPSSPYRQDLEVTVPCEEDNIVKLRSLLLSVMPTIDEADDKAGRRKLRHTIKQNQAIIRKLTKRFLPLKNAEAQTSKPKQKPKPKLRPQLKRPATKPIPQPKIPPPPPPPPPNAYQKAMFFFRGQRSVVEDPTLDNSANRLFKKITPKPVRELRDLWKKLPLGQNNPPTIVTTNDKIAQWFTAATDLICAAYVKLGTNPKTGLNKAANCYITLYKALNALKINVVITETKTLTRRCGDIRPKPSPVKTQRTHRLTFAN